MKRLLLAFLLLGVSLFVGCGGSSGGSTPPPVVTLQSIAITPSSPSITAGSTQQFKATGSYSDGSTKDLTSAANWLSATQSVATINVSGLATAVAAGTSSISASSAGITGTTTLTVTVVPLVSIAVTPATATIAPNSQQAFTAIGTYADQTKKDITTTVAWQSSNIAIANINPAGLAVTLTPGTVTITATLGTISGTATLTVTNPLVSIAVTPPTASVAPNGTQQFTATGTYADQSTKNITTTVIWKATPGTAATITAGGLATGVTPGTTSTITATSGTISGTAVLTITNPLVSIAVTPPTAAVAPNGQQQFTATGTYTDHSTQNITSSVTWSASLGATITTGGLATGVTPNTTSTIMATQGSISGTAVLTITNPLISIAVTPPTASIAVPFTQSFTATGTYADNSTSVITSTVTWASSAPLIATISNSLGTPGLATAVAPGTAAITATLGSVTSPPATLTVTNATLVSIAVTPAVASIPLGNQQQFTATGTFSDSSKQDITNTVAWTSSDTTKATITVSGLATGVAVTSVPVTITATKTPGTPGTASLSVTTPQLSSIAITPNATTLAPGTSRAYTATGTLSNGGTLNVTNKANWQSNNTAVANVNNNGVVTATSTPGTATISATYSGVTGSITITVPNVFVTALTVTPITASIPAGVTQQFNAVATFSDASTQDVSLNATWASDNLPVATVTNFGRAASVAAGTAHISAVFGGQTGSGTLTVSPATLSSIAITPASTVLAPGSTVNYQAVGIYSDSSRQFLANATWASSNPSVVSIGLGTGIATGQSAGSANITATYQAITSNSASVVVENTALVSIAVTPVTASVPEGVSTAFTATGTFADSSTQNLTSNVTWASGQSSVATINNSVGQQGVATGVAAGQTPITAVFAGIFGTATLNVTNATIVSIAVTPANPNVAVGTAVAFTAKGTFSDHSVVDLTSQVTWTSSTATVATINSIGQANTAGVGNSTITATFTQNGVSVPGSTILTVH